MMTLKIPRRIVTIDDASGKSSAVADGPVWGAMLDPARPGFISTSIWVTDATPAQVKVIDDALTRAHRMLPPPRGSVCRIVTFPPEQTFRRKVEARDVMAFFYAMGAPAASTYSGSAPHPYMQKTRTLDFCLILGGEITLVLDLEEVQLKAGDTVVQRGTNHAWSNRSSQPCTIAISSHDAME